MFQKNPLLENYYDLDYDSNIKSVYTRNLQKKLIIEILTKYPTALEFKQALENKNSNISVLIDEKWNRQQYINFLKNNIIRYNPSKKNFLGILVGIGITSASALLSAFGVMGINNNFHTNIDGNHISSDGASLGLGALGGAWLSKKFRKHLDDIDPDGLT